MNQYRVRIGLGQPDKLVARRQYDVQAATLANAVRKTIERVGATENFLRVWAIRTAVDVRDRWPSPVRALGGPSEGEDL